ncbi:restriction endonuclease subunit S [Tropicibacter naphthalenivorans]|uniref:Type I restriction enzyme EcoKI specificity protein n=1 Tax=Tropicibacter naphthalenivorans TaxID=441103 RepID=A0A0P1H3U3_9RHOB|nr:restriction endonuclease subunit S [Tropicibacter naphthalenivorans]CUH82693.1 Type I restriction enzyme EcoKI specificity protein [Tropicibacter naphthalenivorans]SMD11627.1 type I restriction enzyme, S subunit [Tropicibacter naphthalenivorans]
MTGGAMNAERLLDVYEQISEAPDAIARLRRFVLDLAVRGKLVEQDAADEPAQSLVGKIEAERKRQAKDGEIRKRDAKAVAMLPPPYELPASWTWIAVGNCFVYDAGAKTDPKNLVENRWLLELEDVEKDTGRLLQKLLVSDRASKSTKSCFNAGDVLYGKLRPYLNKVIVADDMGYSTTEIVAIRPYLPLYSAYVALAFRRPDFVDYVERKGQGTKMPRLRTEDAVVAPFPLPPLAEQHRIVTKVDELMALCDRLEEARKSREEVRDKLTAASLIRLTAPDTMEEDFPTHAAFALEALPTLTTRPDQIKTLRQTILNLAVRGKLVEQDAADEPASVSLERIAEARDADASRKSKRARGLPPSSETEASELPIGWEGVRLSDIAVSMRYGTSIKCGADTSLVPVLRIPNVSSGEVTLDDMKFGPLNEREQADLALATGDLLMIRSNGSLDIVGRSAVVPAEADGMAFAGYLVRLRTDVEHLNTKYVWMAMNSQLIRDQIEKPIRSAVGLKNVNLTEFGNLSFWLPPLAEQHRIVAKVDALMALCDRLEAALTTAETTRTRLLEALLHEALEPATDTLEAAE